MHCAGTVTAVQHLVYNCPGIVCRSRPAGVTHGSHVRPKSLFPVDPTLPLFAWKFHACFPACSGSPDLCLRTSSSGSTHDDVD